MELRRRTAAALAGTVLLVGGLAAGCSALGGIIDFDGAGQRGGAPAGGRGGIDSAGLVKALAERLGLAESEVQGAVDKAMEAVQSDRGGRPGGGRPSASPSGAPSGGTGEGLAELLAEAIAADLGADEAAVLEIVSDHLPDRTQGR